MRPPPAPLAYSLLARARLRAIIIVLAPVALVGTLAAGWLLNGQYQGQNILRDAVQKMLDAPSYSAVGASTSTNGNGAIEVKERFTYVAPDQASSRYILSARQGGAASSILSGECLDTSVVIQAPTRYSRCNDPGAAVQDWVPESQKQSAFRTLAFQPWRRILWCPAFDIRDEQILGGLRTKIYACAVPVAREAKEQGAKTPPADSGAQVDITVWVREDGYIGRFMMDKDWPGPGGVTSEKLDYVYADFGAVPPIQAPAMASGAGGASLRGQDRPQQDSGAPAARQPSAGLADANPRTAVIKGRTFYLEVARDDYSIRKGLSNRPVVPSDTAMLFVLPGEERWSFWMKDALVPLDIVFLDRDLRIVDVQEMQPEMGTPEDQLRRYQSRAPAQYAIEIRGGLATELGLRAGDQIALE